MFEFLISKVCDALIYNDCFLFLVYLSKRFLVAVSFTSSKLISPFQGANSVFLFCFTLDSKSVLPFFVFFSGTSFLFTGVGITESNSIVKWLL